MVSIYAMCFLGIVPLGTLLTGVLVRHLGAPLTLTLQGLVNGKVRAFLLTPR